MPVSDFSRARATWESQRGIKWWLENSFALKYNSLVEAKRIVMSERGVTQKGGKNKKRGGGGVRGQKRARPSHLPESQS